MIVSHLPEASIEEQGETVSMVETLNGNLRGRLEELKELKIGWLDGKGSPPSHVGLNWLADSFDELYPSDSRRPYLFPTPEGNILAEWHLKPWAPSLEIDLSTKRAEWHALNLDTDVEASKKLDLTKPEDWTWVAEQIRTLGGGAE
jgi:hypothetical protein